jgi:DNA repair protein RecN (Recombination protein N)
MLTALTIENFALIEKLDITFSDGFSIITGETGAGKSILLGALGLVLGKRADLASLKNKDQKCIVEAHFSIENYHLSSFFEENDIDYDHQTIIRREILPTGKSRAFINDSPVNLQQLQDLSYFLIDIHSQHQTLELSEEDFQFKILDTLASNLDMLSEYQSLLKKYRATVTSLEVNKSKLSELIKEREYNQFLFDELNAAQLKAGELEALELKYQSLNNVEFIKENIVKLMASAYDEELGIIKQLKEFKAILHKNTNYDIDYQEFFERINSIVIEFEDVVSELESKSDQVVNDPEKLEAVNQKLQLIYNLQKKHAASSIEELLTIQTELENKVISVSALEEEIMFLEKNGNELALQLDAIALKISKSRSEAIPKLSEKLTAILQSLGMPNVRIKIAIQPTNHYQTNGKDTLEFLFSANKGSDFGALKRVASGGELSRIMLAVKFILSHYSKLPTIIFDEIDTGVSGEIANKMGEIMQNMSTSMQVFAITHLPQIAAKGSNHYKVFKTIIQNNTISELKLLTDEARINEIAEMLSGKDISESALNHARALLN